MNYEPAFPMISCEEVNQLMTINERDVLIQSKEITWLMGIKILAGDYILADQSLN